MILDLRICRKCGVLVDIESRKKDCPMCHSNRTYAYKINNVAHQGFELIFHSRQFS